MKKFKTFISLVVAIAMLIWIPGVSELQVSAEEIPAAVPQPTTYVLRYIDSCNGWRYQISDTGTWQDNVEYRETYYLKQSIKDGDLIVVDSSPHNLNLTVPVSLSNITFNHSYCAVITANSVENVYVLQDSIGVVNGDVQNAFVYDNAISTFNNNVGNLLLMEVNDDKQSVGVLGTVGYALFYDAALDQAKVQYFSVRKGKFSVQEGVPKIKPEDYSTTPPVSPVPVS